MTSRMKLSFNLQRKKSAQDERSSSQPRDQPQSIQLLLEEPVSSPDEQDQEQERQASIRAANDFIHDLVVLEDRWSSHMSLIRINCSLTLSELHALGNLPQSEGVAACRKLIRVPVIHEEISLFIWTQLATIARGSTLTDDSPLKAEKSTDIQLNEGLFLAHLDERFRFDKPASASARGRIKESPPTSPREGLPQRSYFCRPEDIDEVDEDLGDNESGLTAATRGRAVDRSGKSQPSARHNAVRQRSLFSSNGGKNGSHVPLLKWSRERGTSTSASRASSASRNRSDSFAGRLGSAVGELGQKVAEALGDGMSPNQPRNRSRSARSL